VFQKFVYCFNKFKPLSTLSQFIHCIEPFKKTYILTLLLTSPKTSFSSANFKIKYSTLCQFVRCIGTFQKTYLLTFSVLLKKNSFPSANFKKPSSTLSTKHPSPNFQISIGAFSHASFIQRCFGKNLSTIGCYNKKLRYHQHFRNFLSITSKL